MKKSSIHAALRAFVGIHGDTEIGRFTSIPSFTPIFPSSNDPVVWAKSIRENLGLSLEKQIKSPSTRQFYLYLRDQIERSGVFVHCFLDVAVECARGFAIYEPQLPIIGINDEDRPPAKSFTLIHELVHLYKRESSFCNDMISSANADAEEFFCNAVAGELLVPECSSMLWRIEEHCL